MSDTESNIEALLIETLNRITVSDIVNFKIERAGNLLEKVQAGLAIIEAFEERKCPNAIVN